MSEKTPENKEAPNKSEQYPNSKTDRDKKLGQIAVKGSGKK